MKWLRRLLTHGYARHELALPAVLILENRRATDRTQEATVRHEQAELRARLDALLAEVRLIGHDPD